jgi:CHAD domain-containing protein
MDGQRVDTSFTEIEVELTSGDVAVLKTAEKQLRKLGAKRSDGRTKLARALGLAAKKPRSSGTDEEQLRSFFSEQYHAMLAADPGVRLGEDPEAVHKLRVAVRRLRAVLRTAQPFLLAEWVDGLRDELAWLGGALGPLRDDDVMLERLHSDSLALPDEDGEALAKVIELVEAERESARSAALAALGDERYIALLQTIEAATRELPLLDMKLQLDTLALKELRRLEKVLDLLDDKSSDEALHAARIRGKRARYAAELAAPARGKRAQTLIARLKELQDVLGDHNDGIVAESRLRKLAATARAPRAAFTAGRLAERRRALADDARENLPRARRRLARAGRKAWS